MAAQIFFLPFQAAAKPTNVGAPGALAYFYEPGTTTLKAIYADSTLTTQLTNPVEADGAGRLGDIYLDDAQTYRFYLTDRDGALICDIDPMTPGTIEVSADELADGDYGDFTVASGVATLDAGVVTYAKMQDVSATDKLLGRSTAGSGDVEEISCTAAGRALLDDADAAAQRTTLGLAAVAASGSASDLSAGTLATARLPSNQTVRTVAFIIDGGGVAITTGQKGHIEVPFAGTITGWTILADQSGSIVVDVWKDTYANFPPTVADTIAGTEKPTLSAAQKNQDLSLTSWTTAINAGDILAFNVDSAATVTRVVVLLRVTAS